MTAWTDERVERLKAMWAEGKSASVIAAALGGVTRNAVCGKVDRLNLSGHAKAPPTPRASVAVGKRPSSRGRANHGGLALKIAAGTLDKKSRRPAPRPAPVHVSYTGPHYGILDDRLGHLMCRAIVEGSGSETLFCSAPTAPDSPFRFCRAHAAVYLTTPSGRAWSPERRQQQILAMLRRAREAAA